MKEWMYKVVIVRIQWKICRSRRENICIVIGFLTDLVWLQKVDSMEAAPFTVNLMVESRSIRRLARAGCQTK